MASSGASDPFASPGFRFYPTEEELLSFYLSHRLANAKPIIERVIPVVDVYSYHPSELRSMAGEASLRDTEQWFFFCPRAEREVHGGRPARTTPSGYWKATGSPSCVFSSSANKVIGVKRTMVFYQGRAPTGTKTRWKMNEYKAVAADDDAAAAAAVQPMASLSLRNELSVCRVYISTGTLRSFDRRPLNPSGHDQAVHHHQAPSSARTPNTNITAEVIANTGHTENSHDSSSSGSRGIAVDGSENVAVDWSSLITTGDDFSFNDIDFNSSDIGVLWPQI